MDTKYRKQVVILVTACFFLYFILSMLDLAVDFRWAAFRKINLLTDVVELPKNAGGKESPGLKPEVSRSQNFELYKKAELITDFNADTSVAALPQFAAKLQSLKTTKKGKIRIAYLGDSMIEGDILTQDLRVKLQGQFGGYGVGFLALSAPGAGSRTSAKAFSKGFRVSNFKSKNAAGLYISGYTFTGSGTGKYEDKTVPVTAILQKSILFGKTQGARISVNGADHSLSGIDEANRQIIAQDSVREIKFVSQGGAPVFGVSFESANGIFVDNFSFRGITGVELDKLSDQMLQAIDRNNHYDLVVLEYGVNLLFRPEGKDFSYYQKLIKPVLDKLKRNMPNTEFLIVSTADRAFRYDGQYKTAIGMENLIELQASLALEHQMAFYNQFASMGGENTIVKWAEAEPALANKDYVHPNRKGAAILADKLYKAIIRDYKKYRPAK